MATPNIIIAKANPIQLLKDGTDDWWFERVPYFEMKKKYCQKFQKSDTLNFQFAVKKNIYDTISGAIIDETGTSVQSLNISTLALSFDSTYNQYHVTQALSGLLENGQYFVRLQFALPGGPGGSGAVTTYYSEPLHIKTTWSNTLKLEYSHDENDFNIIFNDTGGTSYTFTIRVEGGLKSDGFKPSSDDNIYKNDRADFTTIHSTPYDILKMSFGDSTGIPNWLADKINRAFSCYYTQLNDVYYNKVEGAKFERRSTENYALAAWTLDLVENENLSSFNNIPFPMSRIYWLYRGQISDEDLDPGTPTEDIFYVVELDMVNSRTFRNFGALVVDPGEMAMLRYDTTDSTWYKDLLGTIVIPATTMYVGSYDYALKPGANPIDPSLAGYDKPVFMHQIFTTDDGIQYPVPGIALEYDVSEDTYNITSPEERTVTIKFLFYDPPS